MADRIIIPEELSELSDEELSQLQADISTVAAELASDAMISDEALAEVERMAAENERIAQELGDRQIAANERAERAQNALTRIGSPAVEGDEEVLDEATTEVAGELVAASVEDEVTLATTITGEADTVGVPSAAGAEVATMAAEAPPTEIQEAAVADEITPEPTPDALVASLNGVRPSAADAPEGGTDRRMVPMRSTGALALMDKGAPVGNHELATLIAEKHHQMTKLGGAAHEPVVLATAVTAWEPDQMLVSGHEQNFGVLAGLAKKATALVASGGNCAPLAPSYEIFRVAEPMSPVENALPVVGAPRGGIRYISPPDFRDAAGGVRVTTEAEDAAGYPPTAVKPCIAVECPDVLDAQVDAVSQCVTFGNLNYRVFPEQVEAFLEDLAVMFAETKEIHYLDAINAGSTSVNTTPPYSATRGTNFALAQAAHAYRKRNHMPTDAPLDLLAPDTLLPYLRVDMVNDLHLGLSFLGATDEQVRAELFAAHNLNVTFYYDSATGANQAFNGAQSAGGLNLWPTTYRLYMFSPGTWVRLDLGTLDVGIVRDSTLNSTNDLQIFSEQWIQAVKVGIESLRLNLTLCADGTGPEPTSAYACGS